MNNTIVVIIIIVLLGLGGWWIATNDSPTPEGNSVETNMPAPGSNVPEMIVENNSTTTPLVSEIVVTYTDAGFSPNSVEIKSGQTVKFVNQSTGKMWVGSAMHPTHIVYSGTTLAQHCPDVDNNDFDQCKSNEKGGEWSFTFTKVGNWKYHNHSNATHFGGVVVK